MNKFSSTIEFSQQIQQASVVTIGSFDGVHLGHQALLNKLLAIAKEEKLHAIVLSFDVHPRNILSPQSTPIACLTSMHEKSLLIENKGVDSIINMKFSQEMLSYTATRFMEEILIKQLRLKHIVTGYNHAFGKNRVGNVSWLKENQKKYGYTVHEVKEQQLGGEKISSSIIRETILSGNIANANLYLGRHYSIEGKVIRGNGIGTKIGFPTANVQPLQKNKLIPKNGVYVVSVKIDGKTCAGIVNIGHRPTIHANSLVTNSTIEVHIFGTFSDLYEKEIVIYFDKYLREERSFSGISALQSQIEKDIKIAKKIISHG